MERFAEESQSRSVPRKHSPFLLPLVHRVTKLVSSANPITIDHHTSGKRERGEEGDRQRQQNPFKSERYFAQLTLEGNTEWILWRVQGITVCSFGDNWMLPWLQLNILLLEVSKNTLSSSTLPHFTTCTTFSLVEHKRRFEQAYYCHGPKNES